MDTLLKNLSTLHFHWVMLLFLAIVIGNFCLNQLLKLLAVRKNWLKKGRAVFLSSLLNWLTFYVVILLFLLYFSKSDWLFYTLYSQDGVDVSLFLIVVAVMIVSLAHRLVKLLMEFVLIPVYGYYDVERGLGYTFNQIIYYTVMIIALGISFTSVGIDLTALGAVLSVLGIGIGFGMRNIAGNFVSGIIILFERPVEVGEVIQIEEKIGKVEKIRLRSTIVRTAKEGVLIVPNQYFIEQIIKNRTNAEMMAQVTVSVEYGSDTNQVNQLLHEAVEKLRKNTKGILPVPAPDIRFVNLRSKAMDFLVEIPVSTFELKEQVESQLRHAIIQIFLENSIQLASYEFDSSFFPPSNSSKR